MGRYSWMKVVDVMTGSPLVMKPDESIGMADEIMAENRIRQIPVVDDGALVGIVTDRDLRSFLNQSALLDPEERLKALETSVGEIMTAQAITLSPDDDLREAIEVLIEEKFGAIPVVDTAQGLVGIVSYIDVLRCFLNRLEEDLAEDSARG